MQMTTILGLLIGFGGILLGNFLEGGNFGSLFRLTAALIVFGGTLGATLISHRSEDLKLAWSSLKKIFGSGETAEREKIADEIIQAAQVARRESILALEARVNKFSDPFMRAVYRYAVDGVSPDVIRQVFHEEISVSEKRKMGAAKVWSDAGGFAPTIGIIGAVLGLISLMLHMDDTSMLGQGIAVAFVATIYGVGSANLLLLPVANKLKSLIRFRAETERMIVEGALAMLTGLSPLLIEQKIKAFTSQVKT